MKIDPTSPHAPPDRIRRPPAPAGKPSGFQQIFNEALGQPTSANHPASSSAPLAAQAPSGVGWRGTDTPHSGIHVMEGFIDALEAYQKRLADPRANLRDIAPAFERLETAHAALSRCAAEATTDAPLSSIMNEGLVTSAMEMERFRSGRYC
jgi:hypothetical protein